MTRDEQIARAVVEACAKVCADVRFRCKAIHDGTTTADPLHERMKHQSWGADECAIAIESLPLPDLVAALPKQEPVANQCDGCLRGLPVDDQGIHRDEGHSVMVCQKPRYVAPVAQPDTESVPAVFRSNRPKSKLDSLLVGIPADLARQIREEVQKLIQEKTNGHS